MRAARSIGSPAGGSIPGARPAPGAGASSDWDDKKKKKKARGGGEEPKKGERGGGGASWKNLGKDWDDDD